MTIYRARRGQTAYGYSIGMLCAEWHIAFPPGDIGNASTFPFPIRYMPVPGLGGSSVLNIEDQGFTDIVVKAAVELEAQGVRAITSNCGFMAKFQRDVADAVSIPVFLSSLVQIPLLLSMLGTRCHLGVMTANGAGVSIDLLASIGITDTSRIVMQGLEHLPHFHEVIFEESGELNSDLMEAEVVAAARELQARAPDIRALMLECIDLPPYSKAIHEATGLPVFDWTQFVHFVHNAVVPTDYAGIY